MSGTKHNVFGIQTGVAILFLVRKKGLKHCAIKYCRRPEYETAEEKLTFLHATSLQTIELSETTPDATHRWINLSGTDFSDHLPLCDKQTKATKNGRQERAIFKLYSLGVVTARDEWVYGSSENELVIKIKELLSEYDADLRKFSQSGKKQINTDQLSKRIKWTRAVKRDLQIKTSLAFVQNQIVDASYRPFVKRKLYFDPHLNEMRYQLPSIFVGQPNPTICFTDASSQKPFMVIAADQPYDYHLVGAASAACGVPMHRFGADRTKIDNVTDYRELPLSLMARATIRSRRQLLHSDESVRTLAPLCASPAQATIGHMVLVASLGAYG